MGGADNNKIKAEQAMREQALRSQAEQSRQADMAAGRKRGEELFGNNALGNIEGRRAAEVADLINQRKSQLGGLSQEEQNAFRSQALGGIQQSQQDQQRQLMARLGASGLRGGAAAAQQANLAKEALKQQAQAEQNLFTQNIDRRRQALDAYEGSMGRARQEELGLLAKEKGGVLQTELGQAAMGSQERGAALSQAAGEAAAKRAESKK
jgi:hypothetical protein